LFSSNLNFLLTDSPFVATFVSFVILCELGDHILLKK